MKKFIYSSIVGGLCFAGINNISYAQNGDNTGGSMVYNKATAQNTMLIGQYLENLAFYLGIDVTSSPCVTVNASDNSGIYNNPSSSSDYQLKPCALSNDSSNKTVVPYKNLLNGNDISSSVSLFSIDKMAGPGTALALAGNFGGNGLVNLQSSTSGASSQGMNNIFYSSNTNNTSGNTNNSDQQDSPLTVINDTLATITEFSGSAFEQWKIDTGVDTVRSPQYGSSGSSASSYGSLEPLQGSSPTAQYLLNFLSTPNDSDCVDTSNGSIISQTYDPSSTSSSNNKVTCLSPFSIMRNAIMYPPQTTASVGYNAYLVPMLNVETMVNPLQYNTQSVTVSAEPYGGSSASSGSSSASINQMKLNALGSSGSSQLPQPENQMQQAQNFIRYATGALYPTNWASYSDYQAIYSKATASGVLDWSKTATDSTTQANRLIIYKYLAALRALAAQMSVGVSNLNYVFGRRIPNPKNNNLSTAATEYYMATHRLIPEPDSSTQDESGKLISKWQQSIETASSIKLQREMTLLLAELNYQMYLNRMQQERSLITLSMLQLQSAYSNASGIGQLIPSSSS